METRFWVGWDRALSGDHPKRDGIAAIAVSDRAKRALCIWNRAVPVWHRRSACFYQCPSLRSKCERSSESFPFIQRYSRDEHFDSSEPPPCLRRVARYCQARLHREDSRKWMIAGASFFFAGQGTVRAAGQPQCDSGQTAVAGPDSGRSEDAAAKKQLEARRQADVEKYQSQGPNSATEACQKQAR